MKRINRISLLVVLLLTVCRNSGGMAAAAEGSKRFSDAREGFIQQKMKSVEDLSGVYTSGTLAGDYVKAKKADSNLSWYKMLTGKIDRYPVTLHLHKAGHLYSGYYYYDSRQEPISFTGEDSSLKGKVRLASYPEPDNVEEFVFDISGPAVSGTWKKNETARALPFTATETKPPLGFTYVFTRGDIPLRPKLKDGPSAGYEAAAVWPLGESPTDLFLKKMIRRSFDEKREGSEEIGALLLKQKKEYFLDYLKQFTDAKEAEIRESPTGFSMEASNRLMIAYLSPKLLNLASSNYAYTGGAHGNYGTSFQCIDLTGNKKLTLADVLNKQGLAAVGPLMEKIFRQRNRLKATDSLQEGGLFENKIVPNDNFYLTPKGLGFNYAPYEIGPYAMGEIDIFIPMQELESFLQPAVRRLLF